MFIINPGSGPVEGASEEDAIDNIRHFVTDLQKDVSWVRIPRHDYGAGRYAFLLWRDCECHEIQMPGITLSRVRYMKGMDNVFSFPRLYVNDSSWLWFIALACCFDEEDEDEDE